MGVVNMEILIKADAGKDMPRQFYKFVNFEKGNLNKKEWKALSNKKNPDYWIKWEEVLLKFEYYAVDGCYFLHLDKHGNLCLVTESDIEKKERGSS